MAWNPGQFRTRHEARARKKAYHCCLDCLHASTETGGWKKCPKCDSRNRAHFGSEVEYKRGMQLLMLQSAGKIRKLRFQPSFSLDVNGYHIHTYKADADYEKLIEPPPGVPGFPDEWRYVVEDTKHANFASAPKGDTEKLAVGKMRHFEAQYGVKVTIPGQKVTPKMQKELQV